MIYFIDKVLENMRPYVPLFQTIIWPLFFLILILFFKRQLVLCLDVIRKRIASGSSLKAGPVEIGEDLRKLNYAAPHESRPSDVGNSRGEWVTERNEIYRTNTGLFLTHIITPSKKIGQKYDIFIYLIRHKTSDFSDIEKVEFFFGHMWDNEVFVEIPNKGKIGISTSAYGPFLCTCHVHLKNGEQIRLNRYIDFEMARIYEESEYIR